MDLRKLFVVLAFTVAVQAKCEKPAVIVIVMNGLAKSVSDQSNVLPNMIENGLSAAVNQIMIQTKDELIKFGILLGRHLDSYFRENENYSRERKKCIDPSDNEFFSLALRKKAKTILNDERVRSFCVDWIGSQYTPNGHRCKTAREVKDRQINYLKWCHNVIIHRKRIVWGKLFMNWRTVEWTSS